MPVTFIQVCLSCYTLALFLTLSNMLPISESCWTKITCISVEKTLISCQRNYFALKNLSPYSQSESRKIGIIALENIGIPSLQTWLILWWLSHVHVWTLKKNISNWTIRRWFCCWSVWHNWLNTCPDLFMITESINFKYFGENVFWNQEIK